MSQQQNSPFSPTADISAWLIKHYSQAPSSLPQKHELCRQANVVSFFFLVPPLEEETGS